MNRVPLARRVQIINCLVEGNSIRSTERMTGTHRDTICRLLVEVGDGCAQLMDEQMRELSCRRIQVDEIWAYVGKKQAHLTEEPYAAAPWPTIPVPPPVAEAAEVDNHASRIAAAPGTSGEVGFRRSEIPRVLEGASRGAGFIVRTTTPVATPIVSGTRMLSEPIRS